MGVNCTATWTLERDERLAALLLDGLSASQIATALGRGITRNAVIGRAHRIGVRFAKNKGGGRRSAAQPTAGGPALAVSGVAPTAPAGADEPAPASPSAPQVEPAPEPSSNPRAMAERARRDDHRARKASSGAPAEHIAPAPPAPPAREPMTLLDERFRPGRHCRWPVGEVEGERGRHLFCVAPVPAFGGVYCAHHAEIARARPTQIAERRAAAKAFADLAPKQGRKIVASAERRLGRALA